MEAGWQSCVSTNSWFSYSGLNKINKINWACSDGNTLTKKSANETLGSPDSVLVCIHRKPCHPVSCRKEEMTWGLRWQECECVQQWAHVRVRSPFMRSGLSLVSPLSERDGAQRTRAANRNRDTLFRTFINNLFILFLKNHHSFSFWKSINFQQHSFEKCKVTIQIFNRKKKE